jgi:cystathionine beta-lyase
MANALMDHNLINDVYHPALPHTQNHHIWKRDFSGSTGLFAFSLKKKYSNKKIEKFYNKLKIFKLGYSWGGFESLITFPPLDNRIFKNKISGNIIRIYCGLENNKDQINDIFNALKTIK